MSRENLLSASWSENPVTVCGITLRPLSPGSFDLLQRLGNALVAGGAGVTHAEAHAAAIEYIWIHSAPLEQVMTIIGPEDLPKDEIARLHWEIPMPELLGFLSAFQGQAERMAAAMAETVPEGDDEPGKPQTLPTGSPASSSPSAPQEIPAASGTSYGSYPSSEPSNISTLPTLPREPAAAGPQI